jgi:hypothetical protein
LRSAPGRRRLVPRGDNGRFGGSGEKRSRY